MGKPYFLMKIGDGEEFNIADKIPGLHYLGVDDASNGPQFTNNYEDVAGMDGSWFISQTFAKRTFSEKFWLHWANYDDLVLAKHDLYRLFGTRQKIRVRTDHSPCKVYYGYPTAFNISPISPGMNDADFSIPFEVPSGVLYSLERSDQIVDPDWGMNELDGQQPAYRFTTSTFKVYNASDVKVDPYYSNHDLKVICKYTGKSLTITNQTNGSTWTQSRVNDGSHTVTLDGIDAYYDGTNDNVNSNGGTLSLEPGWNTFSTSGASAQTITFSFPFVYLL